MKYCFVVNKRANSRRPSCQDTRPQPWPRLPKPGQLLLLGLLAAGLIGCGTPSKPAPSTYVTENHSQLQAAKAQLAKARASNDAKLYLDAAWHFIQAEAFLQAKEILQKLPANFQEGSQLSSYQAILSAKLALAEHAPVRAQRQLNNIWNPNKLNPPLQILFHNTQTDVHLRCNDPLAAAEAQIELAKHLDGTAQLGAHQATLDILSQLTPTKLRLLQTHHTEAELAGWLKFTHATKQYDSSPDKMARALAVWRAEYPDHPAAKLLAKTQRQDTALATAPPQKIALLLPLSGTFADSAKAIRDGFLSGYYQAGEATTRPIVRIYDTAAQPDMAKLHATLQAQQVDFIVGPLRKANIEALSALPDLKVPTLALNTLNVPQALGQNFYQFGLNPETEANIVARKSWDLGHRQALILVPTTERGQRMQQAFRNTWQTLGGKLVGIAALDPKRELAPQLRATLGVDQSEARAKRLRKLGLKFSFSPRRRDDIDCILMASPPEMARQIKPILHFYYANDIPVFASSSVYSGQQLPNRDQDLNGIVFCDMPWVLDPSIAARTTYRQMLKLWPQRFHRDTRLYALGVDAYRLAMQVHQLRLFPQLGISGMTGMLKLDPNLVIERRLMWAKFQQGIPETLTLGLQ